MTTLQFANKLNVSAVIRQSYPNAQLVKINEIFYPTKGWCKTLENIKITNEYVAQFISRGVTAFNFEIIDEAGTSRTPDFQVTEFTKHI